MSTAEQLQVGGIALFFLVYLYVWFRQYNDLVRKVSRAPDSSPLALVAGMGGELIGCGCIIFLILLLLILTCFRALSTMAQGTFFDAFSLKMTFGWIANLKIKIALAGGIILGTAINTALVMLSRRPWRAPFRGRPFDSLQSFRESLMVPWKSVAYLSARPDHIRRMLIHSILLANLLVVSLIVILTYAEALPEKSLPLTTLSMVPPWHFSVAAFTAEVKAKKALQ
jgi:hypothetical protein